MSELGLDLGAVGLSRGSKVPAPRRSRRTARTAGPPTAQRPNPLRSARALCGATPCATRSWRCCRAAARARIVPAVEELGEPPLTGWVLAPAWPGMDTSSTSAWHAGVARYVHLPVTALRGESTGTFRRLRCAQDQRKMKPLLSAHLGGIRLRTSWARMPRWPARPVLTVRATRRASR
jgi:hypothetical protein